MVDHLTLSMIMSFAYWLKSQFYSLWQVRTVLFCSLIFKSTFLEDSHVDNIFIFSVRNHYPFSYCNRPC